MNTSLLGSKRRQVRASGISGEVFGPPSNSVSGIPATDALIDDVVNDRYFPSEINDILDALAAFETGQDIAAKFAKKAKPGYSAGDVEKVLRSDIGIPILCSKKFWFIEHIEAHGGAAALHSLVHRSIAAVGGGHSCFSWPIHAIGWTPFAKYLTAIINRGRVCRVQGGPHHRAVIMCRVRADGVEPWRKIEALVSSEIGIQPKECGQGRAVRISAEAEEETDRLEREDALRVRWTTLSKNPSKIWGDFTYEQLGIPEFKKPSFPTPVGTWRTPARFSDYDAAVPWPLSGVESAESRQLD